MPYGLLRGRRVMYWGQLVAQMNYWSDSFENILKVIWPRKRGLNLVIPPWILLELLQKPRTLISRFNALLSSFRGRLGTSSRPRSAVSEAGAVSRLAGWSLELSQPVEYQARRVSEKVFEVRMASKFDHEEVRSLFRRCRNQGDGCLSRAYIDRSV